MPWVRFDDQFPIHRKVKGLSDAAYRLHTEAIFWCARNLLDGFVPAEDVSELASARRPHKFLPELVARGAWHRSGEACGSEQCPADTLPEGDGWVIHDYWDYQPSKEKVLKGRKATAERQQKWRDSRKSNGVTNGVTNSAPSRPGPLPSGERAGGKKSRGSIKPVDNWCGECNETRHIELDTGSLVRCPRCHPHRSAS